MTRMDLEGIVLGEISQTEEDKYCVCFYSYVEYKKQKQSKINEQTNTKQKCKYREQKSSYHKEFGGQ